MKLIRIHIGWKKMLVAMLLMSGVSCINEDLSDCGHEYHVRYDVRLQTNLQTELETELEDLAEKELGKYLKKALSNVFSDQAHDIDLTFYKSDSTLSYEESHIINSNNASYSIFLPVQDYQHLALANSQQEQNVTEVGREHTYDWAWDQVNRDTLESFENGLFSARLKMEVKDQDQIFEVKMYMQNSAAALIINPNGVAYRSLDGVLTHLADGFAICDSLYSYHDRTVIHTKELPETGSDLACLYGVGFPSRDNPFVYEAKDSRSGRKEGRAEDGETEATADTYWVFRVDVTMPDDKVVHNVLRVRKRLKAGTLEILKVYMTPEGKLESHSAEVGASVELDWNDGGEFNPDI